MRLELAEEIKEVIIGQENLEVPLDWVTEQVAKGRYLNRGIENSYDFSQST